MTLPANKYEITPDYVAMRLRDAFRVVALLPGKVSPAALSAQSYGYVAENSPEPSSPLPKGRIRVSPGQQEIADMDEAILWPSLIENRTIRHIVAKHCTLDPYNGKVLHSIAALAKHHGANKYAVSLWYFQGLSQIAIKLQERK